MITRDEAINNIVNYLEQDEEKHFLEMVMSNDEATVEDAMETGHAYVNLQIIKHGDYSKAQEAIANLLLEEIGDE